MAGELQQLPDGILAWHPAPGEWCVKECVGHIVEADRRGFYHRIRDILGRPDLTFAEWDQAAVARERNDCQRPAAELLAEFTTLRQAGVTLVDSLTAADLELGGTHPKVGYLHVRDVLHEWVHHDRNHFRQLLANVQAYVWPAMANAQRFSQDLPVPPVSA
jgi:hypothetical protein